MRGRDGLLGVLALAAFLGCAVDIFAAIAVGLDGVALRGRRNVMVVAERVGFWGFGLPLSFLVFSIF